MAKKNQTQAKSKAGETFSLISNEKLLAIYAAMLKCRLLEQRATALFQHGKLRSDLHVSAGLEATATAAVIDLEPADTLCLAPDDWFPAFVKGLSLEALFRALAPSSLHVDGPIQIEAERKNIFHAPSDSDQQQVLLESARAASVEKKAAVIAAFIPHGPNSLAEWQNTIQAAGSKKLPVIFVHYSDPAEAPSSSRSTKPEALLHGVPSIAVDARDPVAVYRVAYEAIVRARQRRGATLLECAIDGQPASPKGGKSTLADSTTVDPVATMETYLKSKKIEFEARNPEIIAAFNRDLDLATRFLNE
jgi:acetoin:2,6-dichlorophenolindophenol oxidoreductase subunit alpha